VPFLKNTGYLIFEIATDTEGATLGTVVALKSKFTARRTREGFSRRKTDEKYDVELRFALLFWILRFSTQDPAANGDDVFHISFPPVSSSRSSVRIARR